MKLCFSTQINALCDLTGSSLYVKVYKAGQYEAETEPGLPALAMVRWIDMRRRGQAGGLEEDPRRD